MEGSLKKLSIALYWHMHQPMYQLESVYLMPWARLHAVKDYLDMVLILEKYPKLKLNFNIVPTLIDELIDYAENGIHDIHSNLTITPVEKLTVGEKEYILNNFFSMEYETMIYHHPTYRKLFKKRFSKKEININEFSDQEYSDLMALFNLAWIDPTHINRFPEFKPLLEKEKGFTLDDRINIIDLHRKIISQIIPTYKEYIKQGRIELTTSPYNHAILPILCDYNTTTQYLATTENLPENMDLTDDAYSQVKRAIDRTVEVFGVKPKGLWASELCLSQKVLKLLSECGIRWTLSDESILSKTINFEFIRDFRGNLEDPYHLLKVYNYTKDDSDINIIFRDSTIPNLINFEYTTMDSKVAAEDLYNKIKLVQSKLLISPDNNHLLTIAQDGENCWERYKEDGAEFLNTFYSLLENDPTLETVTISDYVEQDNTKKKIESFYPGSWANKDFVYWIGDPVKNLAWNYLNAARKDILEISKEKNDPELIKEVMNELYIAEGSDWFWWYGEPNNSGQDNVFDFLFREHLKNAFKILGVNPPEYLDNSTIIMAYQNLANSEIIPNLNNNVTFVNSYDLIDGPVYRDTKLYDKIEYRYDENNIYLRLHLNPNFRNKDESRPSISNFAIYMRKNSRVRYASNVRTANNQTSVLRLFKKKYHFELMLTFVGKVMYNPILASAISDNLWQNNDFQNVQMPVSDIVDVTLPFDRLEVKRGQKIEMMFIASRNGICRKVIPKETLISIVRPK